MNPKLTTTIFNEGYEIVVSKEFEDGMYLADLFEFFHNVALAAGFSETDTKDLESLWQTAEMLRRGQNFVS